MRYVCSFMFAFHLDRMKYASLLLSLSLSIACEVPPKALDESGGDCVECDCVECDCVECDCVECGLDMRGGDLFMNLDPDRADEGVAPSLGEDAQVEDMFEQRRDATIEDWASIEDASMSPSDAEAHPEESYAGWERSCTVSATPLIPAPADLRDQRVAQQWSIGGSLPGRRLLSVNLNPNRPDQIALFILNGGRVERVAISGDRVWESALRGIGQIYGVWDFNGDGAREILVSTPTQVHLLAVSGGQTLWSSSRTPIPGKPAFSGLGFVKVYQAPNTPNPLLYITDSGCALAGRGYGVALRFHGGFDDDSIQQSTITEPRVAGRCAQWNSIFDPNVHRSLSSLDGEDSQREETSLSIMITDSLGLHRFDAETGTRESCGSFAQMPPAGALPYGLSAYEGRPAWLGFLQDGVVLLTEYEPETIEGHECPTESAQVIAPQWMTTLKTPQARGSVRFDFDDDGSLELLTTAQMYLTPSGERSIDQGPSVEGDDTDDRELHWSILLLDGRTGALLGYLPQRALLGEMTLSEEQMSVFVALSPQIDALPHEIPQRVQLVSFDMLDLSVGREAHRLDHPPPQLNPRTLWAEPIERGSPILKSAPAPSDTKELLTPLIVDGARGPRGVFKVYSADGQEERRPILRFYDAIGPQGEIDERGWGALSTACSSTETCQRPNRIFLSLASGEIAGYALDGMDARNLNIGLDAEGGALIRATGSSSTSWVSSAEGWGGANASESGLVSLSQDGVVSAFYLRSPRLEGVSDALRWRVRLAPPARRAPRAPFAPIIAPATEEGAFGVVALRDHRDPDMLGWVGLSMEDGSERWRHQLPATDWTILGDPVSLLHEGHRLIYRLERIENEEALARLDPCPNDRTFSEGPLFEIDPSCPQRPQRPRVIHALDGETGACLWRSVIRAYNDCLGPSYQGLSLTDGDADGIDELYMTSTNSVRRLDPLNGALISTQLIPPPPVGSLFAGGWLTAIEGGVARFGGNGPPEAFSLGASTPPTSAIDDALLWRAAPIEGLRNQSWLARRAVSTQAGLWLTLGLSLPLARYEHGELIELWSPRARLSDEDPSPGLISVPLDEPLTPSPEVLFIKETQDGGFSLSTLTDGLFFLDEVGQLLWHKEYSSPPGIPVIADWDADGESEWWVSTEDGRLWIHDQNTFLSPLSAWEAACPQTPSCSSVDDIDRTPLTHVLCFGWTPLEGLTGAEVQLQSERGVPLQPWREISLDGLGRLSDVSLKPGRQYRVAIRGWVEGTEGARLYTRERYSDGVLIEDEAPPQASLAASSPTLVFGGMESVELEVVASDEERLAGWSLVVYSVQGALVRLIRSSSTARRTLTQIELWRGRDRFDRPVPPGQYVIILSVTDEGQNQVYVSVNIEVIEPQD